MLESLECIHGANEGLAPVCLRESAAAAALASARAALRLDPVAQAAKNAALRPSRQGEALLMRAVHVRLCQLTSNLLPVLFFEDSAQVEKSGPQDKPTAGVATPSCSVRTVPYPQQTQITLLSC